jgi:hypothetical protein
MLLMRLLETSRLSHQVAELALMVEQSTASVHGKDRQQLKLVTTKDAAPHQPPTVGNLMTSGGHVLQIFMLTLPTQSTYAQLKPHVVKPTTPSLHLEILKPSHLLVCLLAALASTLLMLHAVLLTSLSPMSIM